MAGLMAHRVRFPWRGGAPVTRRPPTTSAQCSRDVVRLLLAHRANPNLLWSGHSPLSLSIASGNDLVSKSYPTGIPARVCLVPPLQRRLWDVLSLRCPRDSMV